MLKASNIFVFLLLLLPFMVSAQLNVTVDGTSPTCNSYTNGSVEAMVSNGTAPYTFAWNGGAPSASSVLASIGAGTYNVIVTDANNQTGSATYTLTEPAAVEVDVAVSGGCSGGGNATANVSGGTGGYTYLWDTGATTASVSGLSFGVHCVTVTDASGCQDVGCAVVNDALSIEMVVSGLACFNFCDASVEAVVTGGVPPYTYEWSNGASGSVNENLGPGTYDVTVTDSEGCTITGSADVDNPFPIDIAVTVDNPPCGSGGTGTATASASGGNAPYIYTWSTGAVGATVSGLLPGTYTVTATDFLGCQGIETVIVVEDDGITLTVLSTPSSGCGAEDGTASVVISGGTAPFDILWSNGSTASDVLGLAPGTYTVMVTDANGCGASDQVTVDGSVAIDLNIMGVNAGCAANGSASAMVTPGTGTPPFQYNWSNGATTSIINNIGPGTYAVTVTDDEGCTATDQVTVSGSSDLDVTTSVTNVSCFGGDDGSATATAIGATGMVFYMWSNGGQTQTISDLPAGTYFVTVVDNASGCTSTTNAFVSQPTEVVATATGMDGTCTDLGSAEADASGGTSPYTFAWSNGATTQSITDLAGGTYTVTATDADGCTDEASVTITGAGNLNVEIEITNPISGSTVDDGELTAMVSGGTPPYTIEWSNGETGPVISNLPGGTYSVTATDVEGCTGTATITLEQLGCIGDRVWEDLDRDGCQEPGEIGIGGIMVTLTGTDVNGNAVNMTTETLANGYYLFEDLAEGNYTVHFDLPADYAYSPVNSCSDDFTDSDADSNGNVTVDLGPGQCNVTIDAGIYDDCLNISDPGEICCDQELCGPGNDPAPLTSVIPATGGGSTVQYMWMYSTMDVPFNNNFWSPIPGANSAAYDPGPLQETTYFIRCAKAADCDTWLESNSVAIIVGDEAFAEITGPNLVCEGDMATYIATDNGPDASYHWDFGTWASPSTSNEQMPTITWNQAGVAYITLTVQNGDCVSTTSLGVAISNSPIICGSPLIVTTSNTAKATMLEWEIEQVPGNYEFVVQRSADGENFSSLAVMPQAVEEGMHEYTFTDYFPKKGNAFYRVELLEDGDHLIYSNVERVQRFETENRFLSYPNPVTDLVTLECNDEVKTAVRVDVLTLQGQQLQREKVAEGNMNHKLDISSLQSGTYFLRMTYNNGEKEFLRIVKQ